MELLELAHGNIIQFLYGENGIDQVKQTQIKLDMINMSNNDIKEKLLFTKEEIKKLKSKGIEELNKKLEKEYFDMRDMLRKIYFISTSNYKVIEDGFYSTINYTRLIQEYDNNKEKLELDPSYIINKLNEIINEYDNRLIVINNKDVFGKSKILDEDEINYKLLLKISLYEYLSPKNVYLNMD